MIIRAISPDERSKYEALVRHPLQSWQWGEFRQSLGQQVERLGVFNEQGQMVDVCQVIFSDLPYVKMTIGYVPRGVEPTAELIQALRDLGKKQRSLFIKLEPNVLLPVTEDQTHQQQFKKFYDLFADNEVKEGRPIFAPYTFVLDLSPDSDDLFKNCKSKTRYNIRLAKRKGVEVMEDTSQQGLEDYLDLLEKTTSRQKFYAHGREYYQKMFAAFSDTGQIRILKAMYQKQVLSAWVLFFQGETAYYPYGASSREHRDVMANNLLMWEAISLAKQEGLQQFDMWGALGPQADQKHGWYGFHKFKEGYNPQLMSSLGSWDVVINYPLYSLFKLVNSLRWQVLRVLKKIGL